MKTLEGNVRKDGRGGRGQTRSQEVEIKFLVADLKALERSLRGAGFGVRTRRTHEMNVLYDRGGELRAQGAVLRIRRYGKRWTFTHKSRGTEARHKRRVESETAVEDGAALERILRALGYEPSFRYEKFRTEWSDGRGQVVVDETPIGNVAEIEGGPRWIDATARKLGIRPEGYITLSYAAMFYEWKQRTGSAAEEMTFAAVKRAPARRR